MKKRAGKKAEQTERIKRYEELFDRISEAADKLEEAVKDFDALQMQIDELSAYYEGLWKKDFEDDEKGLLPKDLKRGVLSEDSVYDLLDRIKELKELIKTVK